jgi:hypothetical protein
VRDADFPKADLARDVGHQPLVRRMLAGVHQADGKRFNAGLLQSSELVADGLRVKRLEHCAVGRHAPLDFDHG